MYYIYSARSNGFLTNGGVYSSSTKDAKEMSHDTAMAICKRHKEQAGYIAVPIAVEDVKEIGW